MEASKITLFCEGMQVAWIDDVPNEDGAVLLTQEQIAQSTHDRRTEISMSASRIYSCNVSVLAKLKERFGLGPFKVVKVLTAPSHEAGHPQHVQIEAEKMNHAISGFWFKICKQAGS